MNLPACRQVAVIVQRSTGEIVLNNFNRNVEETTDRMNQTVSEATERLEKETADLVRYLNDEVVPAVRQHSTNALRTAAEKLARLADYMENRPRSK